ncbi:MAG: hypothetical protein AB4352_18830 [Hormoscilla sp.]
MKELGAPNIHGEGYMYKRTLLMVLMALPLFVTGANLTWTHGDSEGTRETSSSRNAAAEAPLQLVAPTIAARDEQTEQCRWLGTCPEPE